MMIVGALFSSLRWVNNDTFSPRRIDWKAECLFFFGSLCMLAKSWHAHFRVRGAGDATQYFNKWDADGLANRSDTRYFTKTPIN